MVIFHFCDEELVESNNCKGSNSVFLDSLDEENLGTILKFFLLNGEKLVQQPFQNLKNNFFDHHFHFYNEKFAKSNIAAKDELMFFF